MAQKNVAVRASDAPAVGRRVGCGRPPDERTVMPLGSKPTVTLPSRSVRNTRAPRASMRDSVAGDGWPYGLPVPAEATAIVGSTASRNASVDAVLLP